MTEAARTSTSHILRRLATIYAADWSTQVREVLLAPSGMDTVHTLEDTIERLGENPCLLPLAVIDDASLAVVVITEFGGIPTGSVLRFLLTDVNDSRQLALLDTDALSYMVSLEEELRSRDEGVHRVLDEIGPAYQESFISVEKRPRDFVLRPVRIACQNVIVGLAAIAQDSSFDGLSVVAWQTCEVPHVATHEGNRALAALMLADAFQNGGTMEIRFDRKASVVLDGKVVEYDGHPERAVPASLRRLGRTVGVPLGLDDPASISPGEARSLFLAITPMPPGLRSRVDDAIDRRGITPERLCFTLLSQTWREIELDFMLATSDRAGSILEGGVDWSDRSSRQAEMDVARGALMAGMLYRNLNGRDAAGSTEGPRVVEDVSLGVAWDVLDELGAIEFHGLDVDQDTPWMQSPRSPLPPTLTVFFRSRISGGVASHVQTMQSQGVAVAVAVPLDAYVPSDLLAIPLLRCPDRTADLDKQAEAKLLTSRISRG